MNRKQPKCLEAADEPDVWWGEDGIDAMIWADPTPYREPSETQTESVAVPPGDSQ